MKFHFLPISVGISIEKAISELKLVGADEEGRRSMTPKMVHMSVRVGPAEGNIARRIKECMLLAGGEAAISSSAYYGDNSATEIILMGSLQQLRDAAKIMKDMEPEGILHRFSDKMNEALENVLKHEFVINFPRRKLACGRKTLIMGIINATPDSFSDGGVFMAPDKAIEHGLRMAEEGADVLDVGGESTRPGSEAISVDEEMRRVLPIVEGLAEKTDKPISIDTYKAPVARRAIEVGAQMVNDISALGFDNEMAEVVAETGVPVVLMHIKGTPKDMQKNPVYKDLMGEIYGYLEERIEKAESAGVQAEKIVVDPGIGFGKMPEHNLQIINRLTELKALGKPILVGPSRKSFIGKVLNLDVHQRLEGTAAAVAAAIMAGAHIVRVHDVRPIKRIVDMIDAIRWS